MAAAAAPCQRNDERPSGDRRTQLQLALDRSACTAMASKCSHLHAARNRSKKLETLPEPRCAGRCQDMTWTLRGRCSWRTQLPAESLHGNQACGRAVSPHCKVFKTANLFTQPTRHSSHTTPAFISLRQRRSAASGCSCAAVWVMIIPIS